MAKDSAQRKPAEKPATKKGKKRNRYVPASEPLRIKWNQLKGPKHLSQKALASLADSSEGMISQLLTGETDLTIEWALQFAMYMDVSVVEIWADFPFAKLVPGNLTPEEIEFALRYRISRHKQAIANFLRDTQNAG